MTKKLRVYRDSLGEYRWRLIAENGKVVSDSGEGYVRRIDAVDEAKTLYGAAGVDYEIEGENE